MTYSYNGVSSYLSSDTTSRVHEALHAVKVSGPARRASDRAPVCLVWCLGGPKDRVHITRILRSGPKAQDKEDSRNHGVWVQDPYGYVVFWALMFIPYSRSFFGA